MTEHLLVVEAENKNNLSLLWGRVRWKEVWWAAAFPNVITLWGPSPESLALLSRPSSLIPLLLHSSRCFQFSSVQSLSCVRLFATPWIAARQASLSITTSIELVMPSSHLILWHPLLLLPSIFPSIRVFSNESALRIWWPKYWSFSFTISPSNEHPGLVSYRMDWLDLLAVQQTLKSLHQYHSSEALILWLSAFFIVQLSHPYMTTGKTIAFTRWNFIGKVMSLLFNMLCKLAITFLPRSKLLSKLLLLF